MKKIYWLFFSVLMLVFATANAQFAVTTNSGSGLAATYPSLAAAVTALNGATITSPVIITCAAGTETNPAGGYSITATGTATNTIIIEGNGAANSIITAPSPAGTAGNLNDAIFKIIGGDYITIQGFSMLENGANTNTTAGTNTMVEWGVALLYATTTNGAQNNTIQNNTITLNKIYQNTFGIYSNSAHSATTVTTAASATTTAGGNSGLKIYSNNISNVNNGIAVVGPTAAADFNNGIDIGGTSSATANTISNYGTTGTFSGYIAVSGTIFGVLIRNSTTVNVSYNNITSPGTNTAGTMRGIYVPAFSIAPTGTFTNTFNNNTISVATGVLAGALQGITTETTTGTATSSTSISNNNFTNASYTVGSASGIVNMILDAMAHLNTTITGNTFTNLTVNSTGNVIFISNSITFPAGGSQTISNNSIVTAFNKTGAGGTVTGITSAGSSTTGTSTWANNNFSNITLTGATALTFITSTDGGTINHNITGNTLNNVMGGTSAIIGINSSFGGGNGGAGNLVANNTLTNITSAGAITGISIGSSGTISTVNNNTIGNFTSSGASLVVGITSAAPTSNNIFKNKIYSLSGSNASSTVSGIAVTAGTLHTVYNNLIGALTTPAANAANPLNGLNITGGTTVNAYFNTINLAGSSSGALFGSSAISASTTPTLTLRNNIFVNTSSTTGTGLAVAYRRSTATLTSYAAASNKNLFSASTIYTDGTTPQPTLAAYQALVTPRDANSISETPNFLSTNGADATFLHINTAIATAIDAGADPISGITDDFDGENRDGTTPDMGADEFTVMVVSCTGQPAAGSITPASASRCIGQTYSMSATGLTTGTGISYQWQVGTAPGGPYSNVTDGTGATTSSYTTGPLATGVYYYVLQTSCSTSGQTNITNEVVVTVNALPTVAVTPTSATICQPGATAVALTASGAVTYTWSPTAGLTPSTGANVSALPTATTTYTVTGTDGNGCINTATSVITVNGAPIITSVTATPTTVCSGGSTQLQVNVSNSVLKITEVTLFRTGTGQTVAYPAYIAGADLVELSNLSAASVDISGFTLSDYATNSATISHPFTFPAGTIIPSNGVAVVHLGPGTDDVANRYYNAGGANDSWSSGSNVGIVLKAGTQVLDAVGLNTGYVFNAGTGVTSADWSGIASSPSGIAGTIRTAALDGNTGSDWTASSGGTPQTIGTYNGGYTPVSSSFTYSWTPTTGLSDPTIANPLASNIIANTTYNVSVSNGSCTSTGSVAVTLATYNTSVITQPSTAAVTAGSVDNQVILMTIPQACTAETLTQFDFTNASTAASDVSTAKVYYNTTNNFATATLFGTTSAPATTFTVTGSQALSTTTSNFFWLVFDVACNAGNTNVIDGGLTSFIVGASTYSPTPSNPTGTRPITGLASLFTTTQPSTATVTNGSVNQQIVRISVPATGCGTLTNITFNTNGSTNAATDIAAARVYYTTSTTFSTTTQFGTDALLPNGSFAIIGSQALSSTLTNYFWLVYDVSCNATPTNLLDAEVNNVIIAGNVYAPATVNPTGTRTITALYAPTRTDGNSTTAVQLGAQNAQFVYALISGSSVCPGTVTDVNFTVTNPNPTDVVNAKAYYTTTSTFSNAVQFGTSIANPASGALTFTGSQLLATGNNYFWVVYDISCTGTVAASINADINSLVVSGNTIPVTGTATAANALTAITSFTTVADGEWSNTATWACGNVPPTNATAVTIAHNITVSNTGNIGGSVTINTGRSLTINTGGELTLGTVGGGNSVLTNNGTLSVLGGTLNQNGSVFIVAGSTFNQSGGAINVDGNANGVTANSVASGTVLFRQSSNLGSVTGGTITIVDPPATGTARSVELNLTTGGNYIVWGTGHTLNLGDGVSTDASAGTVGFAIDTYVGSANTHSLVGNLIVNGGAAANRFASVTTSTANGTYVNGNLTINSGSELRQTTTGTVLLVNGNFLNNGTYTSVGTFTVGNYVNGILVASINAQTIGGSGIFRNLLASPTAELTNLIVNNSSAAGVTIATPLRISGTLTMTAGRINTDAINLLTLGFSTTSVGSLTYTAGNIVGPFKRWISAAIGARQFPMGNGASLKNASINFTVVPTTAGSLTARWSTTAPDFPNVTPLMEGALVVDRASSQGSWFIDAADGLAGGTYTGTFTANGSTDIADYTKTVLIKRPTTGGNWTLDGTHVTSTGSNTAPVLSRTGMTGFSEFAIGGENNAVLPVTIEFFRGSKLAAANYLDWKVTCTSQPSVQLSLERSADGRNFTSIDDQTATAVRCLQGFNYTDNKPLSGYNYYRLKTTSPDGKIGYSTIVVLLNKEKGFELISLAPNPVKTTSVLSLTTVKGGKIEISVSDITGKVVSKQSVVVIAGNNPITMNFASLGAGTYVITAVNAEGELKTTRFVKF